MNKMDGMPNEIKLIIPKGCDNAPRKQIVIGITLVLLTRKNEIIKEYADESIIWYQLKESKIIEGQRSLLTMLRDDDNNTVECLEVSQVITHGKFASINGVISFENDLKVDFCDVYSFSNTAKSGKVKEIKSYRL